MARDWKAVDWEKIRNEALSKSASNEAVKNKSRSFLNEIYKENAKDPRTKRRPKLR